MTKRGCAALATNKTLARAATRVHDEPAYVLHHYDWSESSLILEILTRHRGRVALVGKGVKRPSSSFRPVLLPLQPLRLSYGGDAEIRTLKSAEWVGGHTMPVGDALFSGLYANELLLRLLARDDPHPALFDTYHQLAQVLAAGHEGTTAPALRAFELALLREVGLLPTLSQQTLTLQALEDDAPYCLVPEGGLRLAGAEDAGWLRGQAWRALQEALDQDEAYSACLRSVAQWPAEWRSALQAQLRALLHYHCGVQSLRTRQVMMDLQALQNRP